MTALAPKEAAMNIASTTYGTQINVPIKQLPDRTHFQGAAWAKDPKTGAEFVWQMQAQPVGPGDVEDLYVHRYSLKAGVLTYLDTMVGKGWGHCQTVKARISAASNAYLLLGWETYDAHHRTAGQQVYRVRYKGGLTTDRRYSGATRVWLKSGWVIPIDSPDWTIGIRRSAGDDEVYEWYSEKEILAATEGHYATPHATVTGPKVDAYQGACITGTYDAPESAVRINGTVKSASTLYQFPVKGTPVKISASNIVNGKGDPEEPESVFHIGDSIYVGKQTTPASRRILAYRALVEA